GARTIPGGIRFGIVEPPWASLAAQCVVALTGRPEARQCNAVSALKMRVTVRTPLLNDGATLPRSTLVSVPRASPAATEPDPSCRTPRRPDTAPPCRSAGPPAFAAWCGGRVIALPDLCPGPPHTAVPAPPRPVPRSAVADDPPDHGTDTR